MNLEQEVLKAKEGDREAFIRLMKSTETALHNTARAMVKRDEDIADVLQETILKAYKSLHLLREPGFFRTWIFRILINECHTVLKKASRSIAVAELPTVPASSHDYDNVDLRMAVDRLEDQQRIAIVLYYFQDMTLKQVAETLDISESAAKTRLYRARKTLLEELRPQTEREDAL
ncbi:RNA polymerase subunit sigma-24 [Paenibacillus albidus]|uniref:RNA polymerase subunit sigma-24 n=1 Tax=Paenibacillus albidus TaxID=2041023 RepID=A0A917BXW5_9BACL|nr:sigma-70 family RNA polymerase sigma factor [Paenibacillus albidus]GGF62243.1 RNA polymerase subunit sigma-24 [Paenibacillus albidus]